MKRIVLISCVSKKLMYKAKVKDIYISPLFKKHMAYARKLTPDEILVLSAKHGMLELEQEIEPYNLTLNNMRTDEIEAWSAKVIKQLEYKFDLNSTHVTFLAGRNYRKFLIGHLYNYDIPFEGLTIGKLLRRLTEELS